MTTESFRLLLLAVDPLTLLDVSQEEAKEAKEDSDDGKTAETEKAASEAMWAVVWHLASEMWDELAKN